GEARGRPDLSPLATGLDAQPDLRDRGSLRDDRGGRPRVAGRAAVHDARGARRQGNLPPPGGVRPAPAQEGDRRLAGTVLPFEARRHDGYFAGSLTVRIWSARTFSSV